jgi:ubiquinone/menaquinone biosynthesis C-methylase UbiE
MLDVMDTRYLPRNVAARPRELATWARYLALHEAVRVPLIGAHRLASFVSQVSTHREAPARNRPLERAVRDRYWKLLAADFENAQRALYPMELLFDVPFAAYARNVPRFLLDAPKILGRIEAGRHDDLPPELNLAAYPAYYRRTFHWQTDGYFSRHSAELYDLGVELLFVGAADVMRRQVLAEVMRRKPRGVIRLLDVGAGTGRFLRQAAKSLPGSELHGVELSPWYAEYAREVVAVGGAGAAPRIDAANAEALPFPDHSFDVVTSIFLLHELPRRVRRTVLGEMRRVLAPGGVLVLEDAAQPSDAPELTPALHQFSRDMHEPFFADYLADDLKALLEESGFAVRSVAPHFLSKVVSAARELARGDGALLH